ncbi:hypothetical protein EON83_19235 [bacterium]|nr:MAG: hypothetical protein EON83_19235 [bacterium]
MNIRSRFAHRAVRPSCPSSANTFIEPYHFREVGLLSKQRLLVAMLGLATIAASATPQPAQAFDGEDPILGKPWHHEPLTRVAAKTAGFSTDGGGDSAADSLAWHAHQVDSYDSWWGAGGLDRLKVTMATATELEKMHFHDLFDANQVHQTWRRYVSGTMAGLLWAKNQKGTDGKTGDVAAAQNIVGASLHAIQDFYSHSNWIDDKARRDKTFFQTALNQRMALPIYTGAYNLDTYQGIKHHGKFLYAASIMNQPFVKQYLSIACAPGSPLGNSDLCRTFEASKKGTPVRFDVAGVKIPDNIIYQSPAGIALDNSWLAEIGVKQRGLTDITGGEAFTTASNLALESSKQWLETLEKNMTKAGAGDFWQRIKTTSTKEEDRRDQFERFSKFPYTFLTAGNYPSKQTSGEEYYLRVRLQTSDEARSGTDSDIYLRANGQDTNPPTLLDYSPRANPLLAYNDFEQSDDNVYIAGPFAQLPKTIELYNKSSNSDEIYDLLGKKLLSAAVAPFKIIGGLFNTISGGAADWIGTEHKVWMASDLANVPTAAQAPGKTVKILGMTVTTPAGQPFSIEANGGDKGHYKATGYITKTAESAENGPEGWREFEIFLTTLDCIKESKWDRGSDSDEPFLLTMQKALPGEMDSAVTEPLDGVDTGESRAIGRRYKRVRVPKGYGMLDFAISFMEHDDESSAKRQELLAAFTGDVKKSSATEERGLLDAVAASIGEDWKLQHITVDAWSRGGAVRMGQVLDSECDKWIRGQETASFTLNQAGLVNSGVTTDDLLPDLSGTDPGTPPEDPAKPDNPTHPDNTTDPGTSPQNPDNGSPNNGNGTSGGNTGQPNTPNKPGDIKIPPIKLPGNTTGNGTGNNGGTGNGTNGNGTGGVLGNTLFKALRNLGVKFDGLRVLDTSTMQLSVTYKNRQKSGSTVTSSTVDIVAVDADGIGFRDQGNLYQATGEVPERLKQDVLLASKDDEAKVSYLFTLPKGMRELKTLHLREGDEETIMDASSVQLPKTSEAPNLAGAVGGGDYAELGAFDIRLDGVKRGRGNTLHAFFSLKNEGRKALQLTAGSMHLDLVDADGITTSAIGNVYRASGTLDPDSISHTAIIEPNIEAIVRYIFPLPRTSSPQSLRIRGEGGAIHSFSLPTIP